MKNYTITVNGNTYAVQVEEGAAVASAPVAAAPKAVAAPAPAAAPKAAAAPAGPQGGVKIECQSAGKVLAIKATVGQAVKKGQAILSEESMKMEIDVVAPQDGTVASINVAAGDAIEQGQLLATLN